MKHLHYSALLSSQEGKRLGPGRGGAYYRVVQQINDENDKTTTLVLVPDERN